MKLTRQAACPAFTELWSDETTLIASVRSGEPGACEVFVRKHGGQMLCTSRRFLRCEHDAADAVQDAFVSAFRSMESFSGASRLSTWLHKIVVNTCLMKLRSQTRRAAVNVDDECQQFDAIGQRIQRVEDWAPSVDLERAELSAEVRRCINELPDAYRTVLLMRDIEELTTEETARILGETRANVKTRLHRARCALRTRIEAVVAQN